MSNLNTLLVLLSWQAQKHHDLGTSQICIIKTFSKRKGITSKMFFFGSKLVSLQRLVHLVLSFLHSSIIELPCWQFIYQCSVIVMLLYGCRNLMQNFQTLAWPKLVLLVVTPMFPLKSWVLMVMLPRNILLQVCVFALLRSCWSI